jgi:Rrf2 family protein
VLVSTNKQFALAVHMLTMLAGSASEPLCSEAMALSANANSVSVRRVLGRFREAGFVASKPGVGGGTHLIRDPAEITLADVWRTVHGEEHVLGVYEGHPDCPVGASIQSLLLGVDGRVRRAVEDELSVTTIAQLMQQVLAGAELTALV